MPVIAGRFCSTSAARAPMLVRAKARPNPYRIPAPAEVTASSSPFRAGEVNTRRRTTLGGFHLPRLALALVRIEEALADAHDLWRDLHQLVVLDVGDCLLQRHSARRGQPNAFVLWSGGTEVGQLL